MPRLEPVDAAKIRVAVVDYFRNAACQAIKARDKAIAKLDGLPDHRCGDMDPFRKERMALVNEFEELTGRLVNLLLRLENDAQDIEPGTRSFYHAGYLYGVEYDYSTHDYRISRVPAACTPIAKKGGK